MWSRRTSTPASVSSICYESTILHLLLAAVFLVWRLDFGPRVVSEDGHRSAVAKPIICVLLSENSGVHASNLISQIDNLFVLFCEED